MHYSILDSMEPEYLALFVSLCIFRMYVQKITLRERVGAKLDPLAEMITAQNACLYLHPAFLLFLNVLYGYFSHHLK